MTETTNTKTKKNWLNIALCAFILFSIGVAGYLGWKGHNFTKQQTQLLTAINTQKQILLELESREQVGARIRAAELLTKAKNYRVSWSQAVKDLEKTFTERGKISFNQVSITPSGEVSVTAESEDLLSAASFLVLVERSDVFENGFISNISTQGANDKTYRFSATFNYLAKQSS